MSLTEEAVIKDYAKAVKVELTKKQVREFGQELEQYASEFVYDKAKDLINGIDERALIQLQEEAINWYLEKTDFDCTEWMNEEDKKRYFKLYAKVNGTCLVCNDDGCEYCKGK